MKKPPYINAFNDRHGKLRVYFRKNGYCISLPTNFSSPEFITAYSDALKKAGAKKIVSTNNPESVSGIIGAFYQSTNYISLAASTKNTYRIELDRIRENHGHKLISQLERRHICVLMDEFAHNPNRANKLLRYIKLICRFAISRGVLNRDPTIGIKKVKINSPGFRDWPEDFLERYEQYWPVGTVQRLAFDLALYTGQRRSDLVKMHRNHISNGYIKVRQNKTGIELDIPLNTYLESSISAMPRNGLFLLETKFSRPYSSKGFGGSFSGWAQKAGVPKGYSVHGLRKSCCRRLAEAGCSANQIMSVSGHVTLKEAERYTKAASQKILADAAIARTE